MIFSFSRMRIVESSLNDSTQSPACSRKARPSITRASAFAQLTRLAGEDERRARLQALERGAGFDGVGPLGLLERRVLPPGVRRPGAGCNCHFPSVETTFALFSAHGLRCPHLLVVALRAWRSPALDRLAR